MFHNIEAQKCLRLLLSSTGNIRAHREKRMERKSTRTGCGSTSLEGTDTENKRFKMSGLQCEGEEDEGQGMLGGGGREGEEI